MGEGLLSDPWKLFWVESRSYLLQIDWGKTLHHLHLPCRQKAVIFQNDPGGTSLNRTWGRQAVEEREMQQRMRPSIMKKKKKGKQSSESYRAKMPAGSWERWLTVAITAAASELGREIPCEM